MTDRRKILSIIERAKTAIQDMSDDELLDLVKETHKPFKVKYENRNTEARAHG